MKFLRDRLRRFAFVRYFADLPPIDRATFWITVALALACGFAFDRIAHAPAADVLAPFDLDVASMAERRS
ncbi:hypothetical protein ACVWXN_003499 [Bradyrhizobium sp. i1.4.4]